jgi:two-component system response regulator CpxR
MNRILLIDDDVELCHLVAEYLATEGFEVEMAHDGEGGFERAVAGDYALAVLDVMLPGINGLETLRRLRAKSRLPVLMLTARGDDVDRIVGLELGADDYLAKPFNPRELVARIRAILRRANTNDTNINQSPERVSVDDIDVETPSRVARLAGQALELTAVEYDLLLKLMRAAGSIVSREELVKEVLGRRLSPFDRSIDMHVSNLRKKLGQQADGGERIKTVRGVGYIYTPALRNS